MQNSEKVMAPVVGSSYKYMVVEEKVSRPRLELRTFCVHLLDRCDNQLRHRPFEQPGD